jgi:hypothetical protein
MSLLCPVFNEMLNHAKREFCFHLCTCHNVSLRDQLVFGDVQDDELEKRTSSVLYGCFPACKSSRNCAGIFFHEILCCVFTKLCGIKPVPIRETQLYI